MIAIKNLSCGYNNRIILQDINLSLRSGEVLGIIGPNGSGKTTLFRAVTGIIKPKQGVLLWQGQDMRTIALKTLARKIAVVSQHPAADQMSVAEYVLLGRIPHYQNFQFMETAADLAAAEKAMHITDVLKLQDRLLGEISGGERQLAHIARALAQEPQLLLLDEPTTHLDITHQVTILDLIRRLNKAMGLTVVMVLHDLNLASEYCHRLLLMQAGRIYKIGTPAEVLDYKIIEEVYNTLVVVEKNPVSRKPYIVVVSEEERQKPRI